MICWRCFSPVAVGCHQWWCCLSLLLLLLFVVGVHRLVDVSSVPCLIKVSLLSMLEAVAAESEGCASRVGAGYLA